MEDPPGWSNRQDPGSGIFLFLFLFVCFVRSAIVEGASTHNISECRLRWTIMSCTLFIVFSSRLVSVAVVPCT